MARAAHLSAPPVLVCAGRTDAGVHATGQVVHVDLPAAFDGDLRRAVNRQLAPRIVVGAAEPVGDDFDARRSATWRHYRYLVWNADVPDPLLASFAWHVPDPLQMKAMAAASDPLLGEHDFRAFCRRPPGTSPDVPIIRRVTAASWCEVPPLGLARALRAGTWPAPGPSCATGRLLRFDVVAGSFCHQMVRSIVAVLVDAGRGRGSAATVMALLRSPDRSGAPRPAPSHGLCLVEVGYGTAPARPRLAPGPTSP